MLYGCLIWGQKPNLNSNKLQRLQNKALLRIFFIKKEQKNSLDISFLYHESKILQFSEMIKIQNFLFAHNHYHQLLPTTLNDIFVLAQDSHDHHTRNSYLNCLIPPQVHTINYGIYSIKYQAISCWNTLVKQFFPTDLPKFSACKCKTIISKYYLDSYIN